MSKSNRNVLECLESLRQQTRPTDEIVLIFDGSATEALESAVEKYQDLLPLKVVKLAQNHGLGKKALNEGLRHCSHEWVFRMDTDDICDPQRFEKQVALLNSIQVR